MVQFNHLNLAQQDYPSPANGTHQVDVLFCRNVLMYFAPQTIHQIVQQFSRSLAPGGWLVVSQTECSHYFQQEFETVQFGQAFLFRKRDTRVQWKPLPLLELSPPSPFDYANLPEPSLAQPQTKWTKPETPTAMSVVVKKSSAELLKQAQTLANQGLLNEACALCQAALSEQKLNAPGHYLHAMALFARHDIAGTQPANAGQRSITACVISAAGYDHGHLYPG